MDNEERVGYVFGAFFGFGGWVGVGGFGALWDLRGRFDHGMTRNGTEREEEMDVTEGWKWTGNGHEKVIDLYKFWVCEHAGRYILGIPGRDLASRPTLRECQELAHATAALWRGDS